MSFLFSKPDNRFLKKQNNTESDLKRFLCENWNTLFSNLTFIKLEFPLKGIVRASGTGGYIDIFAYNPSTKRFVIFELKKDYDKNVTQQADDYKYHVLNNLSEIYLKTTQEYDKKLPKYTELSKDKIEIIVVAQTFNKTQIDKALQYTDTQITLIKYHWFEHGLFYVEYLNNQPNIEIIIKNEEIKPVKNTENNSSSHIKTQSKYANNNLQNYILNLDRITTNDVINLKIEKYWWNPNGGVKLAYNNFIRVNKDTFIKDKFIPFDIKSTDDVIESFMKNDVIPLSYIKDFDTFPKIKDFSWNSYILESYCLRFSKRFMFKCIAHNSYNIGAIYRQNLDLIEYHDVLAYVIINAKIKLDRENIKKYLDENKYLSSQNATGSSIISRIIKKAEELTKKGN